MRFLWIPAACGTLILSVLAGCGGANTPAPTTATPVLSQLHTITTIGSTVDPQNGDDNPYGLAIAPSTTGNVTAGDLLVCNFNNKAGTAGDGTTIEDLSPTHGAAPKRIAYDPSLEGCAALAIDPANGYIWATGYTANDVPVFTPSGKLMSKVAPNPQWANPWGLTYAAPPTATSSSSTYSTSSSSAYPTFYVSNAANGTIARITVTSTGTTVTQIASGFPYNLSSQYGVLAPAGLTYNPQNDTLYIVSSEDNSVVAISHVSSVPANGITVAVSASGTSSGSGSGSGSGYASGSGYGTSSGTLTFSGPAANYASVVYSGSPLNYPVSAALLYNGNLVIGNTGDNNMLELDPVQKKIVGEKLVDSGNAGAIFGIATTGTTATTQKIYFNDDNTNSVVSVTQ